jgi:putative membrane protein
VLAEVAIAHAHADADWRRSHGIIALGGLTGAAAVAAGGAAALALGQAANVQAAGWLALLAAALIAFGALAGARAHGWTELGEQLAIRRGLWKPRMTLLPHASVQSVDLRTDFLQRPLGLATLVFGVPGGSMFAAHEIPAIPIETARALRARILSAKARR